MSQVVQEAIEAGALGFSTSRTMNHRTVAGTLAPTVTAAEEELVGIAHGLRADRQGRAAGWSTIFHMTDEHESAEFRNVGARHGGFQASDARSACFSRARRQLQYRALRCASVERANARRRTDHRTGVEPRGRQFGVDLDLSSHPFSVCPTCASMAELPLAERVALMRRPEVRARLLVEGPEAERNQPMRRSFSRSAACSPLGEPPDYSPREEHDSLRGRAPSAPATSTWEVIYDALLEREGRMMLYGPSANFADGNLDSSLEMMCHPNTVIGLGDGGAHVARICDASIPTHLLTYWTRDRRGERLSLPAAVRMLTQDTARAVGLHDRGVIAPGYTGDFNVIDYDKLALHTPHMDNGLPAGGRRLMQRADGYVATIKSGMVTYRDGTPTGALPGRLIRGAQPQPAA